MRISKRFRLGVSQYELDFVDIDTSRDLPVFVDPHFLGLRLDRWSIDAAASVRSFFGRFIELLRAGRKADARQLFSYLGEPNETCLGLSRGRPRGNAVGRELADQIFDSLVGSKAVKTGVLTDLEDTRVFVHGIDKDRVSDMTTVLIRQHLLQYTIDQCAIWDIPLTPEVPSGDVWDALNSTWTSHLTRRLIVAGHPILLVPKGIVSFSKRYSAQKYHQHFVLTYLKHEHLRLNTALVQKRKLRNGSIKRWVTKKSIVRHESPGDKDYLAEFTERHIDVFVDFKTNAAREEQSLADDAFTNVSLEEVVENLDRSLTATPAGNDDAARYHRLVMGILELCFYPALINPRLETPLHSGRKRIDITFDNSAKRGFFHHLHNIHKIPSAYIMIECKNYSRDVHNPELDQLAGRFGVNRGQFGLLVSRTVDDLNTLIQRCADAYRDGRGLIIPLQDVDLHTMLMNRLGEVPEPYGDVLGDRTRLIAMA
jgi:hypothetical protein